jgi:toxin-antitoxin system PIN domain toxin
MRALLDVNVLIALLDGAHVHHQVARDWLQQNIATGWASCPLTQNGCIRILSQPGYPGGQTPAQIAARLAHACRTEWHEFWPDSISLPVHDRFGWQHILSSRQITDTYLLALAVQHGGRLVTFDRSIPLAAVAGANKNHLVQL